MYNIEITESGMMYSLLFERLSGYLPKDQLDFVQTAYEVAKTAHKDQKRVSGDEYIIHPLKVAYIIAELRMDADSIAAALLHDVVEDTQVTTEQIKEKFGVNVAMLVDGLTKLGKIEYLSKEDQQIENYRKMFLSMAKDIRVVMIKLADRLHNMRTLKYMQKDKQRSISKETLELFAPLAHRLGIYKIKGELEDLAFRYLDPSVYIDLVESVKQHRYDLENIIEKAIQELSFELDNVHIEHQIHGRAKNYHSIYKKMQRDKKEINEIYDILAVRVLVSSVKDCYGVLGIVHTLWKPMPGRFKDYVAMPKSNMYQSLHTTVMTNQGQPLEIQIRTFEMHRISEFGIAAHWRYKEGGKAPNSYFEEKLSWLRQMLEWHQEVRDTKEFVDAVKTDVFTEDEVFVFTPQGDVIDLPLNSVPIDFAYRIHTDVGNRCIGAKVNGRIVPLDYRLKNGDIVEIITSKQASGPSRDWLNLVASSESKNKIRSWFKKQNREGDILKGKELLERESKRLGYDIKVFLKPERLKSVVTKLNTATEENLYASIGYGDIAINTVITKLSELDKTEMKKTAPQDITQVALDIKPKVTKAKNSQGILVKGEGGLLVVLAKCCNPIPGDKITGYITRGRGVSIHKSDCINVLKNSNEIERIIEVSWDTGTQGTYKVPLQAKVMDKPGVLAEIIGITSDAKINISSLNVKPNDNDKTADIFMEIELHNLTQLEEILNKIRRLKNVMTVERYTSKGD